MARYEIAPCPCCAAQAFFYAQLLFEEGAAYIECSDCGVGTPEIPFKRDDPEDIHRAREELTKIWNRRQVLTPIVTFEPRRTDDPKKARVRLH